LLSGDQILIKPPQGKASLGRYRLSPNGSYQQEEDGDRSEILAGNLAAFVQTAMQSLRENRTGVPAQGE
ncbi:MAG: hypothetical protein WBM63_09005, partial [Sedimenticolaceae bacterium]